MGRDEVLTILRRTSTVIRFGTSEEIPTTYYTKDGHPVHLETFPSDFEMSFRWEKKAVDHIEQGPYIHWMSRMKAKDCKHRMSKEALGLRETSSEAEFATALSESLPGEGFSLLDDGSLAEVAAVASQIPDGTFSLVSNEEDKPLELEFISPGADGESIIHGRFTLREHEGGFFTIADWKLGDSSDSPTGATH